MAYYYKPCRLECHGGKTKFEFYNTKNSNLIFPSWYSSPQGRLSYNNMPLSFPISTE